MKYYFHLIHFLEMDLSKEIHCKSNWSLCSLQISLRQTIDRIEQHISWPILDLMICSNCWASIWILIHITHSLISIHMCIEMCFYWHWCHWVEGYLVFSIQSFNHLLVSLFPYNNHNLYLFLMSSMKGDLMNQSLIWLLFIESVFLKLKGFVEMVLRSSLSSPLRAHISIVSDWSLGRSHSSFLSLSLLSITASWQYSPTQSPNVTVVREGRSRFSFYSIN